MYLGRRIGQLKAVDDKTIYATAPTPAPLKVSRTRRLTKAKSATLPAAVVPVTVAAPAVTPVAVNDQTGTELKRLRIENILYRGWVNALLDILKGKNRQLARQQKEIEALRQPEQLTVDSILASSSEKVS